MSRSKNTITVQIQNCVFDIVATYSKEKFTSPGLIATIKTVYDVNPSEIVIWRALNTLKTKGLISLDSTVKRVNHYTVVPGAKIRELIKKSFGYPKVINPVQVVKTTKVIAASTDDVKSDNDIVDSINTVIGKVKDQDFNPLDYIEGKYHDAIIRLLNKNNIEESREMVVVVAAIMGYCVAENTQTFRSRDMYVAINFLSKMTILCKLETLCNSFYIIRAEETKESAVMYRNTMTPINFHLNMDACGVLRPLDFNHMETLTQPEVDELVSDLTISPEGKVSGKTLTSEEIGDGFIAIYKRVEEENTELCLKLKQLEYENSQLMEERNDLYLKLQKADMAMIDLSSKHEKLKKEKGKVKTEITLRSLNKNKVEKKVGL